MLVGLGLVSNASAVFIHPTTIPTTPKGTGGEKIVDPPMDHPTNPGQPPSHAPEPATLTLGLLGAGAYALYARRKKRSAE